MRSLLRFVAALAVMMVFTLSASAQLTRGYISGTVSDPSGAVVASVKVRATNRATNVPRDTVTNGAGVYRLAALEPGVYDLEFSGSDFQTARIEGIEVSSTQEVVVNTRLSVAAPTFTAEVLATPEGVDLAKASATIERRLGPDALEKLPLGGTRDITYFMALAPTAVRVRPSPEFHYVAAGQRASLWEARTEFLADGIDNRGMSADFAAWRPLPEQISEFQVKANTYSAEFGRTSGLVVSAISRSGTNQFHGSVWDYYSASWMAANKLADKRAGLDKPRFQEHHAGASIGGPLRRDRTFFFGLFQAKPLSMGPTVAVRQGQSAVPETQAIPTPAGFDTLSHVRLGPGQTPESRQAILSGLAFLHDAHSLIRKYENLTDIPVNDELVQVGTAAIPVPNQANVWTWQARIDHRLTDRDNVTLRHQGQALREDVGLSGRATLSNSRFGPIFASGTHGNGWGTLASYTHTFGPRAINEFRFDHRRDFLEATPQGGYSPLVDVIGFFRSGTNILNPWIIEGGHLQWQDVLTFQHGRHALKAGADILRNLGFSSRGDYSRGFWTFNNLEDLINNRAFTLIYRKNLTTYSRAQTQQAYFFQDDWRLTPNLVINVGVRYQTAGVPLDGLGGATTPELLAAGVPPPVKRDINDLAPRFGFAWSPSVKSGLLSRILGDGRTVLRGGFGITYLQGRGPIDGLATWPQQSFNLLLFNQATYNRYPDLPPGSPTLMPQEQSFVHAASDARNPTTHFYSLSLQRQLGASHFIEAGFIGNRAYHLWRSIEMNPALLTVEQAEARKSGQVIPPVQNRRLNPAWASRGILETNGYSNYNAGFFRFDRRLARGFLVGLNYTWSATLDDTEGPPQNVFDYRSEYGRANIDRPHRLAVHYNWYSPQIRSSNQIFNHALGGWQIAGYTEWQSGEPFTITTGVDSNGDGVLPPHPDRPDHNPSGVLTLDPVTHDWRTFISPVNGTGVFVTHTPGPLANSMPFGGNLGRNTLRGPAYANTNLTLLKEIVLGERTRVELRASWTNFFNQRSFGPPVSLMSAPNFGTNQSTPDSRVTILGLKIRF
jgi:Carboxypeptidase regulatory-like domain/TonB dependent receptor-like, beta-barrel